MLEELTRLTQSSDFIDNWAFFVTNLSRQPSADTLNLTLEARYDGFGEAHYDEQSKWEVICKGFLTEKMEMDYLRPFYQMKVLQDHPLLWNYGGEHYFSIEGTFKSIAGVMGDLFIVHLQECGGWIDFHGLFGSLPETLMTQRENQIAVPEQLTESYLNVFKKPGVKYSLNTHQKNRTGLSALIFTSSDYPDEYNYGQPYIIAESFEEHVTAPNNGF